MSESFVTYKGFAHYYGMRSLVIKKSIFIIFLRREGHLICCCLILFLFFFLKALTLT